MIQFKSIPAELRERNQWVLWKEIERDGKPTKVPVQADGSEAKSNDPTTWAPFDSVCEAYTPDRHAGIGYVFAADDPFVGIDLDGCRDAKSGSVAAWARDIVTRFASYAELSPSETGAKIFVRGVSPFDSGKNLKLADAEAISDKAPGIEVYDRLRFFAVTGKRIKGPKELADGTESLRWLKDRYWPEPAPRTAPDFNSPAAVLDRAQKYLAKMPFAVSGSAGHNTTFRTACVLVLGFGLSESDAVTLMLDWNRGCQPPWKEKDIERKVREANKQPGPRGLIRDVPMEKWDRIKLPEYKAPEPKPTPKATTVAAASKRYLETLREGVKPLASTSIPELDEALEGGIGFGEMAIFAARPSHGKSALAMQCVHTWTSKAVQGSGPAVIISEEMSSLALGKRTMQHISGVEQGSWTNSVEKLEGELKAYSEGHHDCYIVESCGTAAAAVEAVERHVEEHGCKFAVIDYAQLLRSPGNGRYEQVTNTSIALRQLATRTGVALVVLAQLNRGVESRNGEFVPIMSDLKDSGQLEQDADVVCFLCWPHRMNPTEPMTRYQIFAMKNRNRGITSSIVECTFLPERQMLLDYTPDTGSTSMALRGSAPDDDPELL